MVEVTRSTSGGIVPSGAQKSAPRSFDVRSWQGLTEVLKAAREAGLDDATYADFRDTVLRYAQSGGDKELKEKIDAVIVTFDQAGSVAHTTGEEGKEKKEKDSKDREEKVMPEPPREKADDKKIEPRPVPTPEEKSNEEPAVESSKKEPHAKQREAASFGLKRRAPAFDPVPGANREEDAQTNEVPKVEESPTSHPSFLPSFDAPRVERTVPDGEKDVIPGNLPVGDFGAPAKEQKEAESEPKGSHQPPPPPPPKPKPTPNPVEQEHKVAAVPKQPTPTPPAAPESPPVSRSVEEHRQRIVEIKHIVNTEIGNPVELIDAGNEIGREYMNALLAAMKATGAGFTGSLDIAMARLEKAFELMMEYAKTAPKVREPKPQPKRPLPPTPKPEPTPTQTDEPEDVPQAAPQQPRKEPELPTASPMPAPKQAPAQPVAKPVVPPPPKPEKEIPKAPPAPEPAVKKQTPSRGALPSVADFPDMTEPAAQPRTAPREPQPTVPKDAPAPPLPSRPAPRAPEKDAEPSAPPVPEEKMVEPAPKAASATPEAAPADFVSIPKRDAESTRAELEEAAERIPQPLPTETQPPEPKVAPAKPGPRQEVIANKFTNAGVGRNEFDPTIPDVPSGALKAVASEEDLNTLEITNALDELLNEWGIFRKSGILGMGASGMEHPLYQEISHLPMSSVMAGRWDRADRDTIRTIKDYVNAWRHEQGIVYVQGETFEHYLRRVVQRILKRQNAAYGA